MCNVPLVELSYKSTLVIIRTFKEKIKNKSEDDLIEIGNVKRLFGGWLGRGEVCGISYFFP